MKRLALFLDGTWNSVSSKTNVSRLYGCVARHAEGIEQKLYYDTGVGTKPTEWLRGGALGYGLDQNVIEAYDFLIDNYEDDDEIYIFGFSRGAFTARSLAGMIAKCGLIRLGTELSAREVFRRYQRSKDARAIYTLSYVAEQSGALSDEEKRLLRVSRRVPIKMVGVWDTVGALGIPFGNIPGVSRREFQFYHTRLSNIYEHAYHALAIDEHRAAFEPTLWTRFRPKVPDSETGRPVSEPKVEQRWFVGAHADVGGGNPTTLPALPLAWLARRAEQAGLAFSGALVAEPQASSGPITDSYSKFAFGLYKLVSKRFYRTIQAARLEKSTGFVETVNETIDGSVFARYRENPNYRPPTLQEWARKMQTIPTTIVGAIDARTLKELPD